MDGTSAILLNWKLGAETIFRYIANALFGKAAFAGGPEMIVFGALFHYCFAYLIYHHILSVLPDLHIGSKK